MSLKGLRCPAEIEFVMKATGGEATKCRLAFARPARRIRNIQEKKKEEHGIINCRRVCVINFYSSY